MTREDFEDLVREAIEGLPEEFLSRLDNIDVVVADRPSAAQLRANDIPENETMLGLYEGVPLVSRVNYGLVVPDKITIFQRPLEELYPTREDLIEEVQTTVVHEVAHFFGLDDRTLHEMGLG